MITLEDLGFKEQKGAHSLKYTLECGKLKTREGLKTIIKCVVLFEFVTRRYAVWYEGIDYRTIDQKLHLAIHLKMKELGWI